MITEGNRQIIEILARTEMRLFERQELEESPQDETNFQPVPARGNMPSDRGA
jgi:hypothetical protein